MRTARPKRLLYLLNHPTLTKAEAPLFRALGYEVFMPKRVPAGPDWRNTLVTYEHDAGLTCPPAALEVLNGHDFYGLPWDPELAGIVAREFDVLVTAFYMTPLAEALTHFPGTIVARAFGREDPHNYTDFLGAPEHADLLTAIVQMPGRFVFGQGYPHLADIEAPLLRACARTLSVPLPQEIFEEAETWRGDGTSAIFLCPRIGAAGYYRDLYEGIKADFGGLPHKIFGRQETTIDDDAVLGDVTTRELLDLYAGAPVFVYQTTEPRHVHYSPVEAMVIGTPVLYRRGALLDIVAGGQDLPGACADTSEMHAKAVALLNGDRDLADAIRDAQPAIVEAFSIERAREQWTPLLRPSLVQRLRARKRAARARLGKARAVLQRVGR